jgi:hypothetical protein
VNLGALALRAGEITEAEQVFQRVLEILERIRSQPPFSYWAEFMAGECRLGLGEVELAQEEYAEGIGRQLAPFPRDRESALNGVLRAAKLRALGIGQNRRERDAQTHRLCECGPRK